MKANNSKKYTNNTLKQYYGDISERKRKNMKEDMQNIIKTIDEFYPYNHTAGGVRIKNNILRLIISIVSTKLSRRPRRHYSGQHPTIESSGTAVSPERFHPEGCEDDHGLHVDQGQGWF